MPTKNIPLEASIEAKFVDGIKKLNSQHRIHLKCRKMNGLGYRSWPDRLVIGPKGFFKWIEFKRPVLGKLSDGQVDLFEELSCMGHPVEVHDDFKVALLSLELDLRKHKIIK